MNFFKQLSSAVDKINSIGNLTHQKNYTSEIDPLTALIRTCTYSDEIKFTIQKSVKQILQVYPTNYTYDKLEYVQGGVQKRFIEVKGEINVQMRGKIKLHIMYPATFPKTAPFLRIINPNPTQFTPINSFIPLQSKNDVKSFVLNDRLQSIKKWNSSTSVVNLIIEANNMIKSSFPFQPSGNWGYNNFNQGFSQGSNQGFSQNNQFPNSNQYPNQYSNQYPNQLNQNYNQPQKVPTIPFQTANYSNCYPKANALVIDQKKKLQELKSKHDPLLLNIQNLNAVSYALDSQSSILHYENQKMIYFVNANSESDNKFDMLDMVVPADRVSSQILDLTASIKARQDTLHIIESKFNEEEINLQTFLKNLRKIQEGKFQQKALLIKCLQRVSSIMN